MSGVELVGLLLGALALAEPIAKGLQQAKGVTKSSASFQKYLDEVELERFCYSQSFCSESRRLFGQLLTEDQIDDMFGEDGSKDPRWCDDRWKEDLKSHLGRFYDEICSSMSLMVQTLEGIQDELTELPEAMAKSETSFAYSKNDIAYIIGGEPCKIGAKNKAKIQRRKESLQSRFEKLCRCTLLYQGAINHFLEDQKWKAQAAKTMIKSHSRKSRFKGVKSATPWVAVAPLIDDLHGATQRLSAALQAALSGCQCFNTCHSFHLKLGLASMSSAHSRRGGLVGDARYQSFVFNLLCTSRQASSQPCSQTGLTVPGMFMDDRRISLRIELRPYSVPKAPAPKSIVSALLDSSIMPPPTKKPVTKVKKSVAFALNSLAGVVKPALKCKRKETEELENPRIRPNTQTSENIELATSSTPEEAIAEHIDDLCAWLRRLGFGSSSSSTGPCGPGILRVDNDMNYFIYEDDTQGDAGSESDIEEPRYGSLLDYLSSDRNRFSTPQRMELAHTLALSLLRLHSSCWIEKNWSSKDVMLFLSPGSNDSEKRWSPYVAAAINDIGKIQQIASTENVDKPGYKLSYVVSLGIILLEIGLSRSLSQEDGESGSGDPHLDAYMMAIGEVKFRSLCKDMGPIYQSVVEICVKWRDEFELDDEEVQRDFYEDVVLGLERCIQTANSGAKRRQRRREERRARMDTSPDICEGLYDA